MESGPKATKPCEFIECEPRAPKLYEFVWNLGQEFQKQYEFIWDGGPWRQNCMNSYGLKALCSKRTFEFMWFSYDFILISHDCIWFAFDFISFYIIL